MRDDETGRCHFACGQAQTARRHQIDLVENADDDGEARALETFLDGIQSFGCPRRLDNDQARRIKTEMREARP